MGRPIIKFSKRYGKVLGSINPDNHYPLYMFMYIIIMYALENNSAFNALSKHKLSAIHFIRMQVDCCLEVYACLLYRDKERFFKYFMDGKPTNKLCIGKQYLTAGYLCGELNKRYTKRAASGFILVKLCLDLQLLNMTRLSLICFL